jgi:predicted Zn-dependent protease with MMP-like domain
LDSGGSGGSGLRFFPDAVTSGAGQRPKVDVRVQLEPALAGIPIYLDWRDVDDPSDDDGPIDDDEDPPDPNKPDELPANVADNFDTPGLGDPYLSAYSPTTDANGQIRVTLDVADIQPGNNFRVVAGARQAELARVAARSADWTSDVFYDENGDGIWQGEEPPLYDNQPIFGCVATPLLTIWRHLHVEVDSMGAPPQGTIFPDDGIATDVVVAVVPPSATGLLSAAFEPAYVDIVLGTAFDDANVPFDYHVTPGEIVTLWINHRQILESYKYWSVYVIGAYEPDTSEDLDGEAVGTSGQTETIITSGVSLIYIEVVRDACDDQVPQLPRATVEPRVVVHEVAHQFGLEHDAQPGHLMYENLAGIGSTFTEANLKDIRSRSKP